METVQKVQKYRQEEMQEQRTGGIARSEPEKTEVDNSGDSAPLSKRTGLGVRDYTKKNDVRDNAILEEIYKDKSGKYLRSKWKGKRDDPGKKTLGIPLRTGDRKTEKKEKKTADRIGWTEGHNNLRDQEIEPKVRHENSHALGHGDYGSDNYLSAPPATKFQNTEQLAIEEGAREAASKDYEVRIKITDVINKETGRLEVRRFKISTMNKDGEWICVFDYLMDGQRKGLTRKDTFELKKNVFNSIKNPPKEVSESKKKGARKGIGEVKSRDDEINALRAHQHGVSKQFIFSAKNRAPVNMMDVLSLGPGFTELNINNESKTESYSKTTALSKAIETVSEGKQKENFSKRAKGSAGGVIGAEDKYKKTKAKLQVYLYGKENNEGKREGEKLIEGGKFNKDSEHLSINNIVELGVDLERFLKYSKRLKEDYSSNPEDYEDKDEPVLPYLTEMKGIVDSIKKETRNSRKRPGEEKENNDSKKKKI